MSYDKLFKMPKPVSITGRSSSITNSFINGIIPTVKPSATEVQEALATLGMTDKTICCSYCGDKFTEWDHLRPLVMDKKPTGYISEIHNLVPACGKCNQSKGNKSWDTWMLSDAPLSPKTRDVIDISERMSALARYESWHEPTNMDFEEIVGTDIWNKHWDNWAKVQRIMKESQVLASEINEKVADAYNAS
ncbi:HNH endonuclease [Vibrio sp. E150_011]